MESQETQNVKGVGVAIHDCQAYLKTIVLKIAWRQIRTAEKINEIESTDLLNHWNKSDTEI